MLPVLSVSPAKPNIPAHRSQNVVYSTLGTSHIPDDRNVPMLTIRPEQMPLLEHGCLVQSIVGRARAHPGAKPSGMTPAELGEYIATAVREAASAGVREPDDVERFVSLALTHRFAAPGDALPAWITGLLHHPLLTGSEKMRQITARMAQDRS